MKIRSLRLEQFKKFDQPVRIDGFADGLNLLAGPNEMGKSTLLLALRAALFERHSAKTQAIKGFQPNHIKGSAPTVSVDFEVDRKVYHLEKRFLRRPMARLVLPDGQIREGHEGEAAIRALLRLDGDEHIALDKGSPGHFGVMFTPQSHAFHQPSLAESTRHSLQEAITAEIEQLGNQSEVDAVLANVDAAVFEIVDRRGKPKGRYRDVELRLAETEADVAELRRDRDDLAEDVSALNVAEAGLHDLEHDQGDQDLEVVLHRLEAKRGDLVRDQAIEARCSAAQHRLDSLLLRRQQRRKLNQDHRKLGADSEHLVGEAADLNKRLSALDGDLQEQQEQLRSFEERGEGFQQKRRRLERLNDHLNRRDEIENALQAMATEVTIELDGTALDRVRLDGTPIDRSSQVVQVTEGLAIDIVDVGQIKILPRIEAMRDLREKRTDLHRSITELTETIGVEGLDDGAMEAVWQALIEAESSLRTEHGACEDRVQALSQEIGDLKTTLHGVVARRQQIEGRLAEIVGEIG
ncbi:MAG: AAA family ATPase, partial [Geminicoccaceae bacterium]